MILLNKCPICGGKIYIDSLYQYSLVREIGKRGAPISKSKKVDDGSMECSCIYCENHDFETDFDLNIVTPANLKWKVCSNNGKYYLDTEKHGWLKY